MRVHADVRVVRPRVRGGEENQRRVQSRGLVRPADQLAPDAAALMRAIDREIAQVGAVAEIADRPRHADEQAIDAGRQHDVRIGEHRGDGVSFPHRPPSGQGRATQQIDEFRGGECGLAGISDRRQRNPQS